MPPTEALAEMETPTAVLPEPEPEPEPEPGPDAPAATAVMPRAPEPTSSSAPAPPPPGPAAARWKRLPIAAAFAAIVLLIVGVAIWRATRPSPRGDSASGGGGVAIDLDRTTTTGAEEEAPSSGSGGSDHTSAEGRLQQLRDRGVTFDESQGECLGNSLVANEDAVSALDENTPERAEAEALVYVYVSCFGSVDGAVRAIGEMEVSRGDLNDLQRACVERELASVSQEELVDLVAEDNDQTMAKYRPAFDRCAVNTSG
jgi:hypothetical protein